jgi:hypothetical protein
MTKDYSKCKPGLADEFSGRDRGFPGMETPEKRIKGKSCRAEG